GHEGMAAGAALSGAARLQPAGQHHRLGPAAAVLRQPDRRYGGEPAPHRPPASAPARQPGHLTRRRPPADVLLPHRCRHARLRRAIGAVRSAHPGGEMTDLAAGKEAEDRVAVASNWQLVWWRFRRHHLAMASAALLIVLYTVVLFPGFFANQDPERTDARQAFIPVQSVHFFADGKPSPWVPAIVGKRNPTTLRMEWKADVTKRVPVRFFTN